MAKCIIKAIKPKSYGSVKITYELTAGELLALRHALESYATVSPVGSDVLAYTLNGLNNIS